MKVVSGSQGSIARYRLYFLNLTIGLVFKQAIASIMTHINSLIILCTCAFVEFDLLYWIYLWTTVCKAHFLMGTLKFYSTLVQAEIQNITWLLHTEPSCLSKSTCCVVSQTEGWASHVCRFSGRPTVVGWGRSLSCAVWAEAVGLHRAAARQRQACHASYNPTTCHLASLISSCI